MPSFPTNSESQLTREFFLSLPKIELHRHLEGSVRLATLVEVGRAHGLVSTSTGKLRELVQIGEEDQYTFQNFLSKFQTLRLFYRSPEIIARITRETIADAAADNIRYLELRFTPVALARAEGFPLSKVMDWVVEAANSASQEFGIQTRLIASLNRHEDPVLGTEVTQLAVDRMDKGVVGLDLAGNEAEFNGMAFLGILKEARQAGLHLTIHAGEWGSAENVLNAILYLGAKRIGHGVRVLEDPAAVILARDRRIPFEVCVTSNYQSGVIAPHQVHPLIRMLALGINITLNTDDPSISQITLSDEYRRACTDLGLSYADLRACILNAGQAAFLPEQEKSTLIERLQDELPTVD